MAITTPKKAVAGAIVSLATLAAAPAFAQNNGPSMDPQRNCAAAGGTWYPDMLNGIEGGRCRINLFYGCGFSLHYDTAGNLHGFQGWCFDRHISLP
jgi:hypothetical protein